MHDGKLQLRSKDLIDGEVGGSCGFFSSIIYTTAEHYHDFFEFFLITEGRVNHIANDHKQSLGKGALVFIRPNDMHYYKRINNGDCQFYNLAFKIELAYDLFRFLGPIYNAERLLQAKMPPQVQLDPLEIESAQKRIRKCLMHVVDKRTANLELRKTLMEFFTKYFALPEAEEISDLPEWLNDVCVKMQNHENFSRGLDSLQELACRSHEHLCHIFKRYFNTTPIGYINAIRLDYAASLLTFTDKAIIDIHLESGFGNLSHFYHLFRDRFGLSPNQYRKLHGKSLVPLNDARAEASVSEEAVNLP
jgi:AraC family cel operon transcriptional repressor